MTTYIPIIGAFAVGLIANIAMRQVSSRPMRVLIGVPSMMVMAALVVIWLT